MFELPVVTHDKLLASVFGGIFLGAGIGFVVRRGSVLDGTELVAIILSKKTILTVGDVILVFNVLLFAVVGIVLGIERAMYSILTYIVASKSIDFIIHGFDQFTSVMIISDKHKEIREAIINDMGKGVTIIKGEGGKSKASQDILFCVVNKLELPKIKRLITGLDDKAFFVINRIDDTVGGLIKKNYMIN